MNSWKVIFATIVIFGAGVFTGGLLVNHVEQLHSESRHPPTPPRDLSDFVTRPEILKTNFVQRLDDTLHLSPKQRKQIEKIVADGQERNQDLWEIVSPQFRSVIQDTHQRILGVLTPEQKKQFEGLFKHPRRPQNSTNAPPVMPPTNSLPTAATNAP